MITVTGVRLGTGKVTVTGALLRSAVGIHYKGFGEKKQGSLKKEAARGYNLLITT